MANAGQIICFIIPAKHAQKLTPPSAPGKNYQKDAIKSTKPSKGVTILSRLRSDIHDERERLLLNWIKEKQLAGDSVTEMIICEKASRIYDELKGKQAAKKRETSTPAETFKASHGWLDNFKKRTGIHSVVRYGEAASSDAKAAVDFVTTFASVITRHGFLPQQAFNCDETGLLWKKMPRRTFITAEEKSLPGHKSMKDRLTLAMCVNASSDFEFRIKVMLRSVTKVLRAERVAVKSLSLPSSPSSSSAHTAVSRYRLSQRYTGERGCKEAIIGRMQLHHPPLLPRSKTIPHNHPSTLIRTAGKTMYGGVSGQSSRKLHFTLHKLALFDKCSPSHAYPSYNFGLVASGKHSYMLFQTLHMHSTVEEIVYQTNLYSWHNEVGTTFYINTSEKIEFIGIIILKVD
ncbi:tigger transposable element-derived protein 1-like [Palaemon carinicauda]|uniref:tigger transposable element-derived protein 1-like n=1 Tax=Palaemon carinicauda TaxID=392227 RepID=UPI0035B6725F